MQIAINPTWGVPVICVIIPAIGVTWAKLTVRAHHRRYTVGHLKPKAAEPKSSTA